MRLLFLAAALASLTPCAAAPADNAVPSPAGDTFLFSYFVGNGEDGLHLAASRDGLDWRALNGGASYLRPTLGDKLMRDPCITRGPDGTFHLVWTTGWFDKGVGIAHSKDLVNWSEQTWLPVMEHEPDAQNAWAPEITHDPAGGRFMIYWSSTIPGRFTETELPGGDRFRGGKACNHRIYHTFTTDFKTYTPTALLYDPGFNCIDASITPANGRWIMMIKDETKVPVARKNIRVAWADRLEGPWGPAGDAISPDWVEGPTLFRAAEDWILLYDAYTRHRYEGLRSRDLATWEPVSTGLNLPKGVRHGTVFKVPAEILRTLEAPVQPKP